MVTAITFRLSETGAEPCLLKSALMFCTSCMIIPLSGPSLFHTIYACCFELEAVLEQFGVGSSNSMELYTLQRIYSLVWYTSLNLGEN